MKKLDLDRVAGRQVASRFDRVTIEPFDLRQPCRYDVLDRLSHRTASREWIAGRPDGRPLRAEQPVGGPVGEVTTHCAMMQLGMPIPET
jgi:hypothetical protein